MDSKPRIVIIDQHTLVAEAVQKLLELELGLNVVDVVSDANALLAVLDRLRPDLVLFRIEKPYTAALECSRLLNATYPAIKIIVLTTNENPKTALDCMNNWASAFQLMKSAEELVKAVRDVIAGSKYLSPDLKKKLVEGRQRDATFQSVASLTARQVQVLKLLNAGGTMKEIASSLHITARTVAFHKYRIMAKLGTKNNMELLRISQTTCADFSNAQDKCIL